MPASLAPASFDRSVARLARRLSTPLDSPAWSAPPPALLIDRIETALAARRGG